VTGLRLISDGAFSADYGAVAVAPGVILSATQCITPSENGRFSVIARNGGTVETALPYGVSNNFIGAVSFTVSGIASGATTRATIHLPSGLDQSPNAYIRFNYLTNQLGSIKAPMLTSASTTSPINSRTTPTHKASRSMH